MKRKATFLAVASLFAEAAFAQTVAVGTLPTGGSVTAGTATIGTSGSTMTVRQESARALIDWTSFSVGRDAAVNFNHITGNKAVTANRVPLGAPQSVIEGILSAQGNVMILNGNGVLFGATARVNVGGLVASTGNVEDSHFGPSATGAIAIKDAKTGKVTNEARPSSAYPTAGITVADTGLVAFVAPQVVNSGIITATTGRIVLASAEAATLSLNGNNLYELAVTKGILAGSVEEPGVSNTGSLLAAGGTIVISALDAANVVSGVINLEGVQQATRIEVHGGVVYLKSDLNAATVAGTSSVVHVQKTTTGGGQIQDGIDIAKTGGLVEVGAGTFDHDATLKVNKSLTLYGAGQSGDDATIIDARDVTGYGIFVIADDVSLSNFTLLGPTADRGDSYGIKVQPDPSLTGVTPRLYDFKITNVTGRGAGRAELDLNGVIGATIDGFTADGASTKGAGIQITDSANILIKNSITEGNLWGGVALYQANRFYDQQTTDIKVESNNELREANPLYLQDESASRNFGSTNLEGFAYAVRNETTVGAGSNQVIQSQFTWMQKTAQGAYDQAVKVGSPTTSYIRGWNGTAVTQDLYVGIGRPTSTTTFAMSINQAIGSAAAGATVHVGSGTFAEKVIIDKALTLDGAGIDQTTLRAAVLRSGAGIEVNNASNVTISDLTVADYATGLYFKSDANNRNSANFVTVDHVKFDNNRHAVRADAYSKVDDFRMTESSIRGGEIGVQTYTRTELVDGVQTPTGSFANARFEDVAVEGTTFKGFYFETARNLLLKDVTISDAGNIGNPESGDNFHKFGNAIDINLKYGSYGAIVLDNVKVEGSGYSSGYSGRAAVTVKTRGGAGDSADYTTRAADLQSLTIIGGSIEGSHTVGTTGVGLRIETLSNGAGGKTAVKIEGGTKFGDNGKDIVVDGTPVDARGAVFTAAADGFDIEDRVTHALDATGRGLVTWEADHLYVTTDSGSIQRGVDAACACDTVHVGAGTFTEQLRINKSLILVGGEDGETIVKAPTTMAADSLGMRSIVTIGGGPTTSVEMSGFTVKGAAAGINAGIFVRDGAYAHVHHNKVLDIREPGTVLSGNQVGVGIFVGRASLATSGRALIEDNYVTGYQKGGIVVDGPGSDATIRRNSVIGAGPTDKIAQNGIQASRGSSARIEGNTVSGHDYNRANDDTAAAGILIFTPGIHLTLGDITVGPNDVQHNEIGILTNDPRSLARISLDGVTNNARNAVAEFKAGFTSDGPNLAFPDWAASNAALVNGTAFGSKQDGDIVDVGGTLKVAGWNAFGAIQPAVNKVADGASIDVATGTYAESVVLSGLRNLTFNNVTLQGLTINPGATGSGIRGSVTAIGSTGFVFNAPVYLLGNTSLATTGANIAFNGDVQGFGGNPYALSLDAGTGNVTMVSGGSAGNPLGRLEVDANNFTLLSTLWVSGYDINALGTVALSDHTLRSVGAGVTNEINAGGDITGSTVAESPVEVDSGGSVVGSYTAPSITLAAQEAVSVAVNAPGPVQIHSDGPANVTGSAPTLVVDAPSGSVSGDFGQVTNAGGGLLEVNGKPQLNTRLAETVVNYDRVIPVDVTTAASLDAGNTPQPGKVRRRKAEDAAEVLENGESLELDLSPGN